MLLEFILYYEVEVLVSLYCHFYTFKAALSSRCSSAHLYYKQCMQFIMENSYVVNQHFSDLF